MKLSKSSIEEAKPHGKPYKLFDGDGLFLLIMPNGAKYWRMKYRFNGKENQASLGVYPGVQLEKARDKLREWRALLADGKNLTDHIKQEKQTQRLTDIPARFLLDNKGALSIHIARRTFSLTSDETQELRLFLSATHEVGKKEESCL